MPGLGYKCGFTVSGCHLRLRKDDSKEGRGWSVGLVQLKCLLQVKEGLLGNMRMDIQ